MLTYYKTTEKSEEIDELVEERATNYQPPLIILEKKSSNLDEVAANYSEDLRWYRKKAEIPVTNPRGYILSKDINSRGVKSYTKFETYSDYITYLKNNKRSNLNEIIETTNDRVYMYMDIDRYLTENEGNITTQIITAVISTLQTFLRKRYKRHIEFIPGESIEICTASTDTKCSAHIKTNIAFRTVEEHKIFTMGLVRYIIENGIEELLYERDGRRECVVDGSVYTNFRSYRCLYMSKYGKENYLMPYGGSSDKIEDHLVNYRPGLTKEPVFELEITDSTVPRPITNRTIQQNREDIDITEYNRIANDKRIQTLLGIRRIRIGNIIERDGVARMEVVNKPICPYGNRVHRSNRLYIRYVRRQRKSYICCHDEDCRDRQQYSFTYYDIEETMKGIVDVANITSLHSQQDNIIWDERYTNDTMNDLPKKDLVCVRAGMGTGKTKAMKRFIVKNCNRNDNVLVVTFSRNLAKKYTEELGGIGFVNYQTSEHYQISESKVIICVDSLARVNMKSIDYLFIDEALSVFTHFNSPLMKETSYILHLLETYMKASKSVYMLDACMDHIFMYNIVEYFSEKRRIDGAYWVYNKYIRPTNRKVELIIQGCKNRVRDINDNPISYEAINKVIELLRDGKRVVVSSSTKKFTIMLERMIKLKLPESRILVYNSDTMKEIDREQVINTTSWDGIECLIYSPTITAGVSYEGFNYDVLVGYLVNSLYTPTVDIAIQQMYRVRNLTEGNMYLYMYNQYNEDIEVPVREDDIDRYLSTHNVFMNRVLYASLTNDEGNRLQYDRTTLGYQVLKGIVLSRNRSRVYYGKILEDTLRDDYGIEVVEKELVNTLGEEDEDILATIEEEMDKELPDWRDEYDISEDDYMFICSKDSHTETERIQMRVYNIGRCIWEIKGKITKEIYDKYIKPGNAYEIGYRGVRVRKVKELEYSEICDRYRSKIEHIRRGGRDSVMDMYNQRRRLHYEKIMMGNMVLNRICGEGWKSNIGGEITLEDDVITRRYNNMRRRMSNKDTTELNEVYGLEDGVIDKAIKDVKIIIRDSFGFKMGRKIKNNKNREGYNKYIIKMNMYNDILNYNTK